MSLKVNGAEAPTPDPPTLASLMQTLQPPEPYVVAWNEEFVERSKYRHCHLMDGDRIEILHASVGG